MKKKMIVTLTSLLIAFNLSACGSNKLVSKYGGTQTITLEPGQKLENISWQSANNSLWYTTRPMRDNEFAETHIFQ